jgi:hypothetical protein
MADLIASRASGQEAQRNRGVVGVHARRACSKTSPADGRRARPKVSGKNKTEVRRRLDALRRDQGAGLDRTIRTPTIRELAREWLDKAATKNKAPSTVQHVRFRVENHLVPALGRRRVDKLRPEDVEK